MAFSIPENEKVTPLNSPGKSTNPVTKPSPLARRGAPEDNFRKAALKKRLSPHEQHVAHVKHMQHMKNQGKS